MDGANVVCIFYSRKVGSVREGEDTGKAVCLRGPTSASYYLESLAQIAIGGAPRTQSTRAEGTVGPWQGPQLYSWVCSFE